MRNVTNNTASAFHLAKRRIVVLLAALGFLVSNVGAGYAAYQHHAVLFHDANVINNSVTDKTHCPSHAAQKDTAPTPPTKADCCVAFGVGYIATVSNQIGYSPAIFMEIASQPVLELFSASANDGPFRPPRRES